jgi:hypothetical protein
MIGQARVEHKNGPLYGAHSAIREKDAQRSSQFRLIEGAVCSVRPKNAPDIDTNFANEMVLVANFAPFHIFLLVAYRTDSFGHGMLLPQKCPQFPLMRDFARQITDFLD